MSKHGEIKEIIYNALDDGEVHTLSELQRICENEGAINADEEKKVTVAAFYLKKEGKIDSIGRGKYIRKKNVIQGEEESMEDAIQVIERKIEKLKKINWITSSNEVLDNARAQVELLKKLDEEIKKLISE